MTEPRESDTVTLVDGRVDLPTRRVVRAGGAATLTTLEARLLAYLAARPGENVARQTLLEEVWDYHPDVATRAVDQAVWRLRTKVERDPRQPRHLMTAHGVGYAFEPTRIAPGETPATGEDLAEDAFVGREEELARLRSAFGRGVRMLAVVGAGGVGKTRLARELGFRWDARVVQCDLAHARTEAALVEAVARTLDVVLGADATPRAQRTVLERALGDLGPALVVLDNLEPDGEPFRPLAARWLRVAPEACFLVTSRQDPDLGRLRGVERFELHGLDARAAVTLFERRARAALLARATAMVRERATVAGIVERVERLPLAIELAAARAVTMSVGAIADGLGGALGEGGGAASAEVHGTLAWSWDLLSPYERSALAQLSVFRGGADREAAEAVLALPAGAPSVGEVVAALSAAALLKRQEGEGGGVRHGLLESVADFVSPRLDGRRAVIERHRRYFLGAGERAAAALRSRGLRGAAGWLGREQANLLAAASEARAEAPREAARLALVVEPALARQGPYERHREVLDLAIGAAEAGSEGLLLAEGLLRRAEARRAAGERVAGRADLARVVALVEGLDEPGLSARAALQEARFRRHDATPDAARAAFDEAVARSEALGGPLAVADARRERGTCFLDQHDFAAAQREYAAALAIYREVGDGAASAWTLTRLATVTLELGDHAAAEATFREALAAHDEVGDRRGHAVVTSNLAVLEHEEGRLDRSERHWRAATAIHRTVGDLRFVGFGVAGLGWLAVERGELDGASRRLGEALAIFREAGDRFFAAVAQTRLGVALRALRRDDEADAAFSAARQAFAGDGLGWARAALGLHERLGVALAAPPTERPSAPSPRAGEASFERAARLLWGRAVGPEGRGRGKVLEGGV